MVTTGSEGAQPIPQPAAVPASGHCWFCRRPADPAVPKKLAHLHSTKQAFLVGGTKRQIEYHDACLGYASNIARVGSPSTVGGSAVHQEWKRGQALNCAECGEPGATLCCRQFQTCKHAWHLPCAREAAQREDPAVVFAADVLECACNTKLPRGRRSTRHTKDIKLPMAEPQGLWFQVCGGFRNLAQAAGPDAGDSSSSGDDDEVEGEEEGQQQEQGSSSKEAEEDGKVEERWQRLEQLFQDDALEDAGDPPLWEEWPVGSAEEQEEAWHPLGQLFELDEDEEARTGQLSSGDRGRGSGTAAAAAAAAAVVEGLPPAASLALGQASSGLEPAAAAAAATPPADAAVAGWQHVGCIEGRPPLAPGERMVLGHVIDAPVAPHFRTVTSDYQRLMKTNPRKYPAVVVLNKKVAQLTKNIRKYIVSHCCGCELDRDSLPETLPMHRSCEVYSIAATDPRPSLRTQAGARGLRNSGSGSLPEWTPLGPYQCLQLLQPRYHQMLAQGMKRGELRFKYDCERYAADGDMLQEKCDKGVAVVLPVREELGLDEHRHVMYSAFGYGNETALINDCTVDPLGDIERDMEGLKDTEEVKRHIKENKHVIRRLPDGSNCEFVEVLVFGWPFLFCVTNREVPSHQVNPAEADFRLDYGDGFWTNLWQKAAELQGLEAHVQAQQAQMQAQLAQMQAQQAQFQAQQEQMQAQVEAQAERLRALSGGGEAAAAATARETQGSGVLVPPPPATAAATLEQGARQDDGAVGNVGTSRLALSPVGGQQAAEPPAAAGTAGEGGTAGRGAVPGEGSAGSVGAAAAVDSVPPQEAAGETEPLPPTVGTKRQRSKSPASGGGKEPRRPGDGGRGPGRHSSEGVPQRPDGRERRRGRSPPRALPLGDGRPAGPLGTAGNEAVGWRRWDGRGGMQAVGRRDGGGGSGGRAGKPAGTPHRGGSAGGGASKGVQSRRRSRSRSSGRGHEGRERQRSRGRARSRSAERRRRRSRERRSSRSLSRERRRERQRAREQRAPAQEPGQQQQQQQQPEQARPPARRVAVGSSGPQERKEKAAPPLAAQPGRRAPLPAAALAPKPPPSPSAAPSTQQQQEPAQPAAAVAPSATGQGAWGDGPVPLLPPGFASCWDSSPPRRPLQLPALAGGTSTPDLYAMQGDETPDLLAVVAQRQEEQEGQQQQQQQQQQQRARSPTPDLDWGKPWPREQLPPGVLQQRQEQLREAATASTPGRDWNEPSQPVSGPVAEGPAGPGATRAAGAGPPPTPAVPSGAASGGGGTAAAVAPGRAAGMWGLGAGGGWQGLEGSDSGLGGGLGGGLGVATVKSSRASRPQLPRRPEAGSATQQQQQQQQEGKLQQPRQQHNPHQQHTAGTPPTSPRGGKARPPAAAEPGTDMPKAGRDGLPISAVPALQQSGPRQEARAALAAEAKPLGRQVSGYRAESFGGIKFSHQDHA